MPFGKCTTYTKKRQSQKTLSLAMPQLVGVPGFEGRSPREDTAEKINPYYPRNRINRESHAVKHCYTSQRLGFGVAERRVGTCSHLFVALTAQKKRQSQKTLSFAIFFNVSGRLDSNQRPPTPEAGALTGLRYTPNRFASANIMLFLLRCSKKVKFLRKIAHFLHLRPTILYCARQLLHRRLVCPLHPRQSRTQPVAPR